MALPNANLLVLAMINNIDLDESEFSCTDKARIRSALEGEWVYTIPGFLDELEKAKRAMKVCHPDVSDMGEYAMKVCHPDNPGIIMR